MPWLLDLVALHRCSSRLSAGLASLLAPCSAARCCLLAAAWVRGGGGGGAAAGGTVRGAGWIERARARAAAAAAAAAVQL